MDGPAPFPPQGVLSLGYAALSHVILPFAFARLLWRGLREPAYLHGWSQRLGRLRLKQAVGPRIWLHAVSVGEVRSLFPLISKLQEEVPGAPLFLSTTTPTGMETIRTQWGKSIDCSYLPFDAPPAVETFLDRLRPSLALVAENEIWPAMFRACHLRGIPLALINARLSERSWKRYRMLSSLFRPLLSHLCLVAAQSDLDAGRFRTLGARADRVSVPGNLKFDVALSAELDSQAVRIRQELFGHRPVCLAASTHEGEEAMLLRVFQRVRSEHPQALLVLAPRHPVRAEALLQLCRREGYVNVARRSHGQVPREGDSVYLLDTLGELLPFCGAAEVVFVGGSLVPHGGHNVLEPAALGVPVLIGRYHANFHDIVRVLVEAGAACIVENAGHLAASLSQWLSNAELRSVTGRRGQQVVHANRGATIRLMDDLRPFLPTKQAPSA